VTGSTVIDYQTKIDWFGTVRGRVGYLWGDGAVLSYLTGGLAYGKVGIQGTSTVSGTVSNPLSGSFFNTQAFDQSHVNTGWVVGFGTEGKLLIPGWTYRIETLYMDLGRAQQDPGRMGRRHRYRAQAEPELVCLRRIPLLRLR
jgi:outer membrane immunogenic protein